MAPQVELSHTLAELYSLDGGDAKDIALVYAFPNQIPLSSSLPISVKYAYQGPRTDTYSSYATARVCLGIFPQYYGFIAGHMDLYLFDQDRDLVERFWDKFTLSWSKRDPEPRVDAQRSFEALASVQKPRLQFVGDVEEVRKLKQKKAVITPMDVLEGYGTLVDQDAHWDLLSKRSLALCSLPSPPTQVLDTTLKVGDINNEEKVKADAGRMLKPIREREAPFVVKLPLGLGGHAVFMVRGEAERAKCLEILEKELPVMFRALTPENESSNHISLLIQDVVPGETFGVSIFVTKSGRPIYISTSEPVMDEADTWTGGFMDYRNFEKHGNQFKDIINELAAYVHERGYVGPMGVDIMIDENGKQLVVDMNIRQTGSYTMGLMRKHFYENHNLPLAGLLCPFAVKGDRDQFEAMFKKEIEAGELVITAWNRARTGMYGVRVITYSQCSIVVGAKNRENLDDLLGRLKAIQLK